MPGECAPLTDYADALDTVLARATPLGVEDVELTSLLGRVLAEPIRTAHDMPFFDTSAMDGYALTIEDVEALERNGRVRLELAGTAAAGSDPSLVSLRPGAAVKILTGAAAPEGTAAVVMQEEVTLVGESVEIAVRVKPGQSIRRRGEEFRSGDEVVPAGTLATPGVVAAIAACGQTGARVYRRPRIGLLVTGDELALPGATLGPGQIYDANSFGLNAALQALGLEPPVMRRVGDDLGQTCEALAELLGACDVVLASGGVSVGEFDEVKPALAELGVETVLWGVAIKPGKPFYFGSLRSRTPPVAVFGLPGNPVSAMVTFHVLVRPYLVRTVDLCGRPALSKARLTTGFRKKPGRLEFVPCRVAGGTAEPIVRRGSHMLGTLVATNGLVLFPKERDMLEAGEEVEVMSLEGGLL